ncbi:hypothetical protein OC25_07635 [Pedobacter kyungheensis]|uniref:UspA domain-containing protein n=1 Tax=Pedobacter kyungheensis TaxID=1069985 RepID=A0A0C1FQH1_9SPHI|nr:hypothetical protein OC25_07635 [Pedobacter kyungheensis]
MLSADFSAAASNAAEYAFRFAEIIGADLVVVNAVRLPLPSLTPAGIDYPIDNQQNLLEDALQRLNIIKNELNTEKDDL